MFHNHFFYIEAKLCTNANKSMCPQKFANKKSHKQGWGQGLFENTPKVHPFSNTQDIHVFLQDLGEAELLAVVHSTGYPTAIGAVSVINHFFGRDDIPLGAFKGEFGKEVITPE